MKITSRILAFFFTVLFTINTFAQNITPSKKAQMEIVETFVQVLTDEYNEKNIERLVMLVGGTLHITGFFMSVRSLRILQI